MAKREELAKNFQDTQAFYRENTILSDAVAQSRKRTILFDEENYLPIAVSPPPYRVGAIKVSKQRTFQAAMNMHREHPEWKIAVLNFASAKRPGGGVLNGSSAQEESLCRCSTLYPTLDQQWLWDKFYNVNRASHNPLHTDACIYSPGVVICKSDEDTPKRLSPDNFVTVDIISCAAPNLGNFQQNDAGNITDEQLKKLRRSRATHILHIAAAYGVDAVILGAFGCGVFCNDPNMVRIAFESALQEFHVWFEIVEFAIYCKEGERSENYEAFRILNNSHYNYDDVKILRAGTQAREIYGEGYGGQLTKLTFEQLNALQTGDQLAIPVMDGEYVLFIST